MNIPSVYDDIRPFEPDELQDVYEIARQRTVQTSIGLSLPRCASRGYRGKDDAVQDKS